MARDGEIRRRLERVEKIVERLEAGECSLLEAEALYEEGQEYLREVRDALDGNSGTVLELD